MTEYKDELRETNVEKIKINTKNLETEFKWTEHQIALKFKKINENCPLWNKPSKDKTVSLNDDSILFSDDTG